MKTRIATPATLEQAIRNGLADLPFTRIDTGSAEAVGQVNVQEIRDAIRDYLSQSFGAAMISAKTEEEINNLSALFKRLVNEEKKAA